jgi:Rieske 2Fe-2S family protein
VVTDLPIDPGLLASVLRPRSASSPLPPQAYGDPDVLQWEWEHLFEGSWVCVGREEHFPGKGDFETVPVGRESILVVRGGDGVVRAFFNVCQHRGTRLVMDAAGSELDRIVCPYHSWTYGTDGRLVAAEHTREETFDRAGAGLSPVAVDLFAGWVFVNVSGDAPPLLQYLEDLVPRIARVRPQDLRACERREYEVAANWKLLTENFQECYHCPTIHPELVQVTPYRSGSDEPSRGPWLGGPMELSPGCTTMSMTGRTSRPPIPGTGEADRRLVFYYSLLPNLWMSLHPDYVMTHTITPLAPDRTRVVCEWLFHPDAADGPDFDPGDAVEFWDLVNRQDWSAVERVQLGVGSRGFRGGHFSTMEGTVHQMSALLARSYLLGRVARMAELDVEPARALGSDRGTGKVGWEEPQSSPQNSSRRDRSSPSPSSSSSAPAKPRSNA